MDDPLQSVVGDWAMKTVQVGGKTGPVLDKDRDGAKRARGMRTFLARRFHALGQKLTGLQGLIPELGPDDEELLAAARGLSMTPPIAQWEFIQSIRHIERNRIAGDIVECGVWRGGNLVIAGLMRDRLK